MAWWMAAALAAQAISARRTRKKQIELANTAHQRETKDLIAAGLNPILSANRGAPVPQLQDPLQQLPTGTASAVGLAQLKKVQLAEEGLKSAQALTEAERTKTESGNARIAAANAEVAEMKAIMAKGVNDVMDVSGAQGGFKGWMQSIAQGRYWPFGSTAKTMNNKKHDAHVRDYMSRQISNAQDTRGFQYINKPGQISLKPHLVRSSPSSSAYKLPDGLKHAAPRLVKSPRKKYKGRGKGPPLVKGRRPRWSPTISRSVSPRRAR